MKSITKSLVAVLATTATSVCVLAASAFAATETARSQHVLEIPSGSSTWTVVGGISTYNANNFWEEFNQPNYSNIGLGGYTSSLKAYSAYSGNYKWASVTVRNSSTNSTKSASTPESQRNNQNVSATSASVGTITQGDYFTFLQNGTGASSGFLEKSCVTVNKV